MKGNLIEAPGPWGLGTRPPCSQRRSWQRGFIQPSSWGAGCCFCLTSSCSSWQHRGAGEHNTCGRSSCRSCISERAGGGKARWCRLADEAPCAGWTLSGHCSLPKCSHAPAACARDNQTRLVRRDALLVSDFGFDILSGVTGLPSRVIVLPIRVFTEICISESAAWPPH